MIEPGMLFVNIYINMLNTSLERYLYIAPARVCCNKIHTEMKEEYQVIKDAVKFLYSLEPVTVAMFHR